MRTIRYVFLAILAVALVAIALGNRTFVTLNLLPAEISDFLGIGYSISLPLFLVVFAAILVGFLLGYILEYLREHKHRSAANKHRREKEQLAREVSKLKVDKAKNEGDEVLALLDT